MRAILLTYKYLPLLLLLPLLMSCDPFTQESIYPSHRYSFEILNDTESEVCVHMNFDLNTSGFCTMGENTKVISKGESYSIMSDRVFKSNTTPFKTAWKGISSNKLYLASYVYSYELSQDISLIQRWDNQSENNEFFKEEYWSLKEWDIDPADEYNIHHFVWTFIITKNL